MTDNNKRGGVLLKKNCKMKMKKTRNKENSSFFSFPPSLSFKTQKKKTHSHSLALPPLPTSTPSGIDTALAPPPTVNPGRYLAAFTPCRTAAATRHSDTHAATASSCSWCSSSPMPYDFCSRLAHITWRNMREPRRTSLTS